MYLLTLIDTAPDPVVRTLFIIGVIAATLAAGIAGCKHPPEFKP